MLRVIDTRPILGNGGEIALVLDNTLSGYVVEVIDPEGSIIAEAYKGADKTAALEAYRHPFVNANVPDIFNRSYQAKFEIEEDEDDE